MTFCVCRRRVAGACSCRTVTRWRVGPKDLLDVPLSYDLGHLSDALTFVPFVPELETAAVLAWKKDQTASPATAEFLQFSRNAERA